MTNSLRESVQSEVVRLITKGLEEGSMSEDRAREIARMILQKLPEDISNEELIMILPQLDDEFAELSDVVVPILTEYEEKVRTTVEAKILDLLKQKKFAEARETAKKAIEYSSKLG